MSHKTTVKVEMTNLNSLKKCLTDLGYTFEETQNGNNSLRTTSQYSGANDNVCIRLNGYTNGKKSSSLGAIGFRREKDGTIKATGDFWRITDIKGKRVSADSLTKQLKKRYTVRRVTSELSKQGFMASKNRVGVEDTNGKIVMQFTRS